MRIEEGGRQIPPPPPPPPPPHDNYTSADAAERHALAASAPAPAPAPPPPSAQARATDKEVGEARAAQKEVDSLRSPQAKASIPPRLRAQELREAQEVAQQQWRDVPPAIRTELAAAGNDAKDPADANQRRAAVADEATRIRTRLGEDPRLVSATLAAQYEVSQAQPAVAKVERAYADQGAQAAAKELDAQLGKASPALAKDIALSAVPVVDRIAGEAAKRVDAAYDKDGAGAAAAQLRSEAESAPPIVSAAILRSSQPTVEKIAKDLGDRSVRDDHPIVVGRGALDQSKQIQFDRIVGDLAAASHAAERDPSGTAATEAVAKSLVQHLDPDNVGRTDEALGNAIADGKGAELSVAVVQQLKSAGRTHEADNVLNRVEDGLNTLRQRFDDGVEAYAKAHEEKFYLQSSYGQLADSADVGQAKGLQAFWEQYENDHPKLAKTQADLDRLTTAIFDASTVIGNAQGSFAGLDHADDVAGANMKVQRDEHLMDALSLSPTAQRTIADQTRRQEVDAGDARRALTNDSRQKELSRHEHTALELMAKVGGQSRNAVVRGGITMTKYYLGIASQAVKAGDTEGATRAIKTLDRYADVLGYSGDRRENFTKRLDVYARMADARVGFDTAGGESNAAAASQYKTQVAELEQEYSSLTSKDAAKALKLGPTFDPSARAGAAFRALGAAFAIETLVRGDSVHKAFDTDLAFKDRAKALLELSIASQQVLLVGAGAFKARGVEGIFGKTGVSVLDGLGDQVPFAAAAIDTMFLIDDIRNGNVDATGGILRGTGIAGNISLGLGFGGLAAIDAVAGTALADATIGAVALPAAATGIGAVLVGVSFVGSLIWGAHQRSEAASKFETPLTEKYLQTLGFKPEIAHEFQNQDGDGHSPGPVIAALAGNLGFDLGKPAHVQQLVKYLNGLSKDQMHDLVVHGAHGIDPGKTGDYETGLRKDDAYLALPADPNTLQYRPQSNDYFDPQTGRATTVQYQADKKRWYDPKTDMFFVPGSDRWFVAGDRPEVYVNSPYDRPAFYDPKTEQLMRSDGFEAQVWPHSLDGLALWMRHNGYPALAAS